MSQDPDRIIRSHVLWAIGAGLLPIPLVDFAAVTAVQLDMLKDLAACYGVDYDRSSGKAFVSALTSTTFAAIGSSIVKAIPGLGSVLGGVSMALMSGASTYAVGQVVKQAYATSGSLEGLDLRAARRAYEEAFEQGKSYVADLQREKDKATQIFESLERLEKLKQDGLLTEAEFEAKKQELFSRL
ncbi:MAG: DUF697 domain-containing protein [Thermostichales cyanobacterium BF4_bins_65]